jgi:3-oxoacyl-[acyl-carrier protein] reductase
MPDNDLLVITGASGGVGVALVEVLARTWRNIICHYRTNRAAIAEVLTQHNLDPAKRLVCADLSDEKQVESMHKTIHERFGSVYGLINLAGASTNAMSWKMTRQEFQNAFEANLLTTFLSCRQFIPEMRSQGRGRIVNISSVVAQTGVAGASHYSAAKAGIIGFSKSLSLELAPKNIAVSVIALGYFQYGMINTIPPERQDAIRQSIPARQFGNADQLAGLLAFLLSEAGAYSGGQVYHLNGGLYS